MDIQNILLGSPTKMRLLSALMHFQSSDLGERELARIAGVSVTALRHAAKDLEEISFLQKKRISHVQVWMINKNHYYYPFLVKIIRDLNELPGYQKAIQSLLIKVLGETLLVNVDKIYLFGSVLYKKDFSDIDLGIVLKSAAEKDKELFLESFFKGAGDFLQKFGKNFEPHVYTSKEWQKVKKTPLGESILKGMLVYPV